MIPADGDPVRVVIKAHGNGAKYLRTLPLHESQRELAERSDDEAVFFEYSVCPNYDLYQTLLAQGEQIEVVEPTEVREEMRRIVSNLTTYYK